MYIDFVGLRSGSLLENITTSEKRYSVGKAAQQDVIKAQTQISILDLQLERVQQEQLTREGELNALLARRRHTVGLPDDLHLTASSAP
jgi:outer membrane protein TolC